MQTINIVPIVRDYKNGLSLIMLTKKYNLSMHKIIEIVHDRFTLKKSDKYFIEGKNL